MNRHVLVCDYDPDLLSRLRERTLVVRVDDPRLLPEAADTAGKRNLLYAAWIESRSSLADLELAALEPMGQTAVSLKVGGFGNFRDWVTQVPLLRRLSVMVVVDAGAPDSYRDLRILASLGVAGAIRFDEQPPDWEALADLMSYAVYGKVPHAPIQPFQYVVDTFRSDKNVDIGDIYLENPSKFLHLDAEGRVFLSRSELEKGQPVLCDLGSLDAVHELPSYVERTQGWREIFLKEDGCAYCPAWRMCLGRFERFSLDDPGCAKFFGELYEAAEFYLENREKRRAAPFPWDDPE